MAGRRLRTTVLEAMSAAGVTKLALGTYANEYSQYITTREEYSSRQYEGASTLFGPHTLAAYQQVAAETGEGDREWGLVAIRPGPRRLDGPRTAALPRPQQVGGENSPRVLQPQGPRPRGQTTQRIQDDRRSSRGGLPGARVHRAGLPAIRDVAVRAGDGTEVTMSAGQLLTIARTARCPSVADVPPSRDAGR